jgi:hypothetical protein
VRKIVEPLLKALLPLVRPYIVEEVKDYVTRGLDPVWATSGRNLIQFLDEYAAAVSDGCTTREKAALHATAKRLGKNLPDMVSSLKVTA